MIDWDCDGYGPGSPLGPDADDNDATVNTPASALAKYGNASALLGHLGYAPLRMLFIAPTGNDATGQPNNATLPYATWNGVAGLIQPGDAVIWRGGTYAMSAPMYITGGTAANPNLYMAFPGEKVVLDWSACNNTGAGCTGFSANDVSYWTMDGLTLNGGNGGYGVDEQGYGTPTNITFRNVETIGWYDGLFIQGGFTNLLIQHSYFHDLYINGEHNLYLGANPNITTGLVIENNIIAKAGLGGGHNIHLNGRFTGAYIGGNIMYGAENQTLGLQEGVNHATIENNIIFTDIHGPIFFYDYGDSSDPCNIAYDQNYNVIRNNTFYYDGADYYNQASSCNQTIMRFSDVSGSTCVKNGGTCSGLTCTGGTGGSCNYSNPTNASHDLGHNTIDNNILVTGCTGAWASEAAFRIDTDINGNGGLAWLATDTFRNNIVYSNGGYQYGFLMVNDFTDSVNYNDGTSVGYTFAQFEAQLAAGAGTNLQLNPLLVAANPAWYTAPQSFNLQVQTGSPAIGAGLATDAPAVDIMGKSRGSAPDIGAYQYGDSVTVGLPGNPPPPLPTQNGPPTVSSLECGANRLMSNDCTTCTVRLGGPAPFGGADVALTSNTMLLRVPSSVTAGYGTAQTGFTVTAGSISANWTAVITATLGGASATTSVSLTGTTTGLSSAGTLVIQGTPSEISGAANGATVTPATAPAGLTGQLTVRGTGSVNFGSSGVSFETGGQQNDNTAFYTFTGAQLQNIFNVSQGQINFNLTSSYNLAARLLLPQYSYRDVFDGFDNGQELFLFQVQAEQGRLIFCYNTGGTSTQSYWVPAGTEDALFGQGVTLPVKLAWSGSSLNLYLNGTLVSTTSYGPATPNWTSASSFTLGANDPHVYGGGYFSCDDAIGGFQALNLASGLSN